MPTVDLSTYHQPSGTAADGTKFDNLIDAVQAALNGLDKNNLAAAAGILPSQLADPTTGKVLGSSGSACAAVFPPGYEFDRAHQDTDVSVTAITTGTANTITTGAAVTYDGATVVWIDFSAYAMSKGTTRINIGLYEDGVYLKDVCDSQSVGTLGYGRLRRTPTAGSHTYSVRAYVDAGTGTVFATGSAPIEMTIRKV